MYKGIKDNDFECMSIHFEPKKNILVRMKLNFLILSSIYNQTFTFYDFKSETHKMDITTFQINI